MSLSAVAGSTMDLIVLTAGSNGAIRLWSLTQDDLSDVQSSGPKQAGRLLSTYQTGNRVTCLGAYVMDGKPGDRTIGGEVEAEVGAESSSDGE